MNTIFLATEDELSESVGLRLLKEFFPDKINVRKLRKGGNGYLTSNIHNFSKIALQYPVCLITDLDNGKCAPELIAKLTQNAQLPQNFIFRIAVREVESWLLADHEAIKTLLGSKASTKLHPLPDNIPNPKQYLLKLALKAPRQVRKDLVADAGAIALQGLGYNNRLSNFIHNTWNPTMASERSDSLKRACESLKKLQKHAKITINVQTDDENASPRHTP